jgi:hypothetical protein
MTSKPEIDPRSADPAGAADRSTPVPEPWGWTRRQRIGLGVLLTLLLVCLIAEFVRNSARLDDPAMLVDGQPITLPQRMDPNTASAAEMARIPHIGDTLAQKIVQYREARKSTAADGIVFHHPADLDPIPGIGKKLIEQVGPFLQFPDDPSVPTTDPDTGSFR